MLPWPLLHWAAHFRLHKLYSPLLEFTCILSIHTLPANAAQTHTSPTDMWSVTHNSSQHLSCFPKPKSKSSDETCCRVQTQSILKIKFCDQALFAEGNSSLATSEHSRISRQSQCYKNASVVWVHPIVSALLPRKWFSWQDLLLLVSHMKVKYSMEQINNNKDIHINLLLTLEPKKDKANCCWQPDLTFKHASCTARVALLIWVQMRNHRHPTDMFSSSWGSCNCEEDFGAVQSHSMATTGNA